MTGLIQSRPFLRAYRLFPHRLLNQGLAQLVRARRPRWAVDAAIRLWVRRAGIDLQDFEDRAFDSVEDFFLRRLRPGARPLARGLVSPVDGRLLAAGEVTSDAVLMVKGQRLSIDRVVNGRHHRLPLGAYQGGRYAVIFLSPRGYHYVHMPVDGEVVSCQWIPGRYFPQNEAALRHIPRVYERNERVVLRCRMRAGPELLLVMVGASLVGGIHLRGFDRAAWVHREAMPCSLRRGKGEELGHFTFGSTVVLLLPRGAAGPLLPPLSADLHMGQALFADSGGDQ